MFAYLDTSKMSWIIYRPDLHKYRLEEKKIKRVANGWLWFN